MQLKDKKIKLTDIPAGTTGLVRGRVVYSHIARAIDGSKLEEARRRAESVGWYPPPQPYRSIIIEEPEILSEHPDMRAFLMQRCYLNKANIFRFEGRRSSPVAPCIGHLDKESGRIHEIDLRRELAIGSEVQLLMSVYQSKSNDTNGLGLEHVTILDSEIRYWSGDSMASRIAHGVAVADMVWVPKYKEGWATQAMTGIPDTLPQCLPSWCAPQQHKGRLISKQADDDGAPRME